MTSNNFNLIAPYYDRIARLVFGDGILESQKRLIDELEEAGELLILGGGTGQVLSAVPLGCSITYIEKSEKMLQIALRKAPALSIEFINRDFLEWETDKTYDFLFCPFFLDCFNHSNLSYVLSKCKKLLKTDGRLLVADFDYSNTNRLLNVLMHFFFKVFASLESNKLKNIDAEIQKKGFLLQKEDFFVRGMIFSRIYRNL